ncbi:SDR family oxidoreductase [Paenibacillus urinalis]|uniref:SDR family oxidoreductase n=1 Tax=Paenibacillus urinalis TaxID=521520 RepID=A0AAX3N467_9BACL|nr:MULTISPECIES: SDR family oxidoreductase [Paenibacillus]WDH84008.1 SDR family oxidoreductase [Paenibacillus urinalis]WDH95461.1 SDR family oxidoreductase [Paenibacillus urinalis]WDI03658.1 SDR family oxidoreductase [Paenibacillus urinalis]GAK39015.1 short-chain dehydrogenase/reductase SDR [Paenibacillus sp. TCA20]
MARLEGKVAIVTGAGSGMGRATAKLYAQEGAKVVLAEFNEASMNETLQDIQAAGGTAVAIRTDVSKEADVEAMIQKAVSEYGKLDILANVAGIFDNMTSVENTSNELFERVMGVNLNGQFYACRSAIKVFNTQETGGTIVNVASVAGYLGARGGAAYTMSKHAAIGLVKNIASFYGRENGKIRANVIAPGSIATGMTPNFADLDPLGAATFGDLGPFNGGEAEDIAQTALFLGSDESKFINGEVITVDGAWTAR